MDIRTTVIEIVAEILELDPAELHDETYLIRDLGADSLDLLEIAVNLSRRFKIQIDDDEIFLRSLRQNLERMDVCYPSLSPARLIEIRAELDAGPVLKLKDLISYLKHHGV